MHVHVYYPNILCETLNGMIGHLQIIKYSFYVCHIQYPFPLPNKVMTIGFTNVFTVIITFPFAF